jgi:tetratricopeptide (TPR) repeat protein
MFNFLRMKSRYLRLLLLGFSVMLTASCATARSTPSTLGKGEVSVEMLLAKSPIARGGQVLDLSTIDILGMSPGMVEFVEQHVGPEMNTDKKVRGLVSAIMDNENFKVDYEDQTRTASQTFQNRLGNCLSFTNMFIALARHAGLNAAFQEVEIPPDWSLTGHAFLLSEHVNALVNTSHGSDRMIDFNTQVIDFYVQRLDPMHEMSVISDQRAFAHYFNNVGAEFMLQGGETLLALSYFYESIRQDAGFSSAWVNLGVLHRREGYTEFAEAAYIQALAVDSSSLVAMSNLANLYAAEGLDELADYYRSQVKYHRLRNPYYLYALAGSAVTNGDYNAAIDHLKQAIRLRENEDRFYALMSVSYSMMGENDEARHWMRKAEEMAVRQADKERYHSKLESLELQAPNS